MSYVLGGLGLLVGLALLMVMFVKTDAARLARGLRFAFPMLLGLAGLAVSLVGRAGLGGILLAAALSWLAAMRLGSPAKPKARPKRSSVRTAALEMELDHETGALEGLVLAGRHEQRVLGTMSLRELREVHEDLLRDAESRQLLETYLDGRFPIWRDHAQPGRRKGEGVAPSTGAMTEQEAYKILGLEAGATPADIREAHRRLMQRLHPDLGGTSILAARINEAKDVLLANHH